MITAPGLPQKGHGDLDHKLLFISFPVILQNHILPNRVLNKAAAAGVLATVRDMTMFQKKIFFFWSSPFWTVIASHKHEGLVNGMYWWLIQALLVKSIIYSGLCRIYLWEQFYLFKKNPLMLHDLWIGINI